MNNTTALVNQSPQTPILVLLCLIFVVGLLGNLSVCIVIINNKCMRTATNYYLFSLAVSDIVIIICSLLPWILNIFTGNVPVDGLCLIKEVMAKLGYFASLLTITALSAERYIAICHPFTVHTVDRLSKNIKVIIMIWFVAFCLSLPKAIYTHCYDLSASNSMHQLDLELLLLVTYAITSITTVAFYVLITLELRKAVKIQSSINTINQKKVIKMLAVVVITLLLCWTPTRIHRYYYVYMSYHRGISYVDTTINYYLKKITRVLYYVISTTINPLLYNLMSSQFRKVFKETLNNCNEVTVMKWKSIKRER